MASSFPAHDDDALLVPDEYVVPKIFLLMLSTAKTVPDARGSDGAPVFHFTNLRYSPRFQRVWIQGVVVDCHVIDSDTCGNDGGAGGMSLVIDDSTGPPIEVYVPSSCRTYCMRADPDEERGHPTVGSYVACVGSLTANPPPEVARHRGLSAKLTAAKYALRVERLHDIGGKEDAQREAMWNVEVVEAFKTLEFAHHSRNGWVSPKVTL